MCGRYTLTQAGMLPTVFEVSDTRISPRFNIAPSQSAPVVRLAEKDGGRELALIRWGLIPAWFREIPKSSPMINARSETVHEKASFRSAFRRRRCLVPADGFFEWEKKEKRKQPHHFRLSDGSLFAFAGLWDRFKQEDDVIDSYTILTCAANDLVGRIHERMPVILPRNNYGLWLDPEAPAEALRSLLTPFDAARMASFPVNLVVNSPANDSEECVRPLA